MELTNEKQVGHLTGEVIQQVTLFSPWLRHKGYNVGVSETIAALHSLTETTLSSPEQMCTVFRSIYARTPAQWNMFSNLFKEYFLGHPTIIKRKQQVVVETKNSDEAGKQLYDKDDKHLKKIRGKMFGHHHSDGERYALKVDGQILQEVKQMTERAVRKMIAPPGRKWEFPGKKQIDLRKTIRASLPYVGEPFHLVRRRRSESKRSIVFLFDISGSMKQYANFYSTLAWSFLRVRAKAHVFLFSTKLLRVTPILAREGVSGITFNELQGLHGGTRIGDSFRQLIAQYPTVLHRHTYLFVASDGFDAGDPKVMHRSMEELSSRVKRIIWLNPLLDEPTYEPTAIGMSTALPYVDSFLNVHNQVTWRKVVKQNQF